MVCPVCAAELKAVERQGVELDYCPQCKGLWLDEGELNELIRRESVASIVEGQRALSNARHQREFDEATSAFNDRVFALAH